jgi:GNAT superfamily N-acetyltransferase
VHDVIGVASPDGAVVSVPPEAAAALGDVSVVAGLGDVAARLGGALGRSGRLTEGMFRWCERPTDLPDAGVWIPIDDPRVPEWLRPFNGDVLVALEDDRYLAGVGIKRHDAFGHELAVGTDEAARGRGLARRLVAQAARAVIAAGAVPTYLHDFDNVASGKVAEAAGFPDRGWRILGFE